MAFRKCASGNADTMSRNSYETYTQCLTKHEDPKKEKMRTRMLTIMTNNKMLNFKGITEEIDWIKGKLGRTKRGRFKIELNKSMCR